MLTEKEEKCRLSLIQFPGIGPLIAKLLIEYFGSALALFKASKHELEVIPGIGKVLLKNLTDSHLRERNWRRAEEEWDFTKKSGIQILHFDQDNYPQRLKPCEDSPALLFFKGTHLPTKPKVLGIVGTRKMTNYGSDLTKKIIQEIQSPDLLIISGLAYGIDGAAHKNACENNIPNIGVLAHGLDNIYPSKHHGLAKEILKNGGLLTECFSGTPPTKESFPKRNRIVAGMCDAILVVEAAQKAGSLITAHLAHGYGREVMAVPGKTIDNFSQGCNQLIKSQKAGLVESGEDVIKYLGWDHTKKPKIIPREVNLEGVEQQIYELLSNGLAVPKEILAHQLGLSLGQIAEPLFILELEGLVNALPGDHFQISA